MTDIRDAEGTPIKEEARVRTGNDEGTVVRITEPDGDVNEHGHPVAVGPYVIVEYDDGATEHWVAQNWDRRGELDHYVCTEVVVVP